MVVVVVEGHALELFAGIARSSTNRACSSLPPGGPKRTSDLRCPASLPELWISPDTTKTLD
eukprot:2490040-Pyramimonas_sp.AAC.1